jgi:hypothetical protein
VSGKLILPGAESPAGESEERAKTNQEITHDTEMGQKVKVNRDDEIRGDVAKEAGRNLLSIGQYLQENDRSVAACNYVGSAAVHVYQSEMLGQVVFFCQTNTLCGMSELTASNALTELMKRCQQYYRPKKKIGSKRSGW